VGVAQDIDLRVAMLAGVACNPALRDKARVHLYWA
jgi:hypothetical protein